MNKLLYICWLSGGICISMEPTEKLMRVHRACSKWFDDAQRDRNITKDSRFIICVIYGTILDNMFIFQRIFQSTETRKKYRMDVDHLSLIFLPIIN